MSFYTMDLCYSTLEQLVPDLYLLAVSAWWVTKHSHANLVTALLHSKPGKDYLLLFNLNKLR